MFKKIVRNNNEKQIECGPLLSVVIPSYNHEKFIKQAIESVLLQTYRNLELIVVDDGSKDNSVKIINKIKDERLKLIVQENQGAHNAINHGLEQAKGEYLAILNSDDIFEKERFEIMIREMQASPQVAFTCSYIQIINNKDEELGIKEGWRNMEPWEIRNKDITFAGTDDFKLNLLMSNFISTTSNFLFTRKLYEKIGGMRNLRFAHDWDFALRAAEAAECKIIERPLMRYRVHDSNTISSNRKWMLFEIAWIWAANLDRFYKDIFFQKDMDMDNMVRLAESINLQGNDKIFWIIKTFIEEKRRQGVHNPEEILLDNHVLRNRLLDYVIE